MAGEMTTIERVEFEPEPVLDDPVLLFDDSPSHPIMRRAGWPLLQLLTLVVPVALWQWLASHKVIDPFFWGTPSKIWDYIRTWLGDGTLWNNSGSTVEAAAVGFALGSVIALVIGVALGLLPFARAVLDPFLAFLNGLPRIIFYPFFAIWLGYTETSKISLVVFVIVIVMILNVVAGMQELPADQIAHVRLIGGSQIQLIRQVYLPSLVAWILSSARLSAGFALQAAVVSEFLGPTKGLGYLAALGTATFDINETWAAIALVIVIGIIVDALMALLQRRLLRWQNV
jgi:NitT/TauT family transport system permease protein